MHRTQLLAGLFVLSFSLEARGAKTRGLEWSDRSTRRFTAMFSTGDIDVLCTYVSATKTGEGGAYCLGSIAHVDPWLCPLGAVDDALVADCHREGQDLLTPPDSFAPSFHPTDVENWETGVEPKYWWASASAIGIRPWYNWRQFQSMRGRPFKATSSDFHRDNLRKAAGGAGINLKALSTHAFLEAAAQKRKESGVAVADNLCHGMWNLGAANGAYHGLIPNTPMVTALSGRSADCPSPATPRLSVKVHDELQSTICPWLADEEAAYTARLTRDTRCQDQAVVDFFSIIRKTRSVFFRPGRCTSSKPACPRVPRSSATLCAIMTTCRPCARRWRRCWPTAAAPSRRPSRRSCRSCLTPSRWPLRPLRRGARRVSWT